MELRIHSEQLVEEEQTNLSVLQSYGIDIWQSTNNGCSTIAFQNARGISREPTLASKIIDAMG